jgi:uncharacterized iron-regulated protein
MPPRPTADGVVGPGRRLTRRSLAVGGVATAAWALVAGCASDASGGAGRGAGGGSDESRSPGPLPADAANPAGDDPLVIAVATAQPLPSAQWLAQLRRASIVLLGEVHDNPAHHRIRGGMLRQWAERVDPPAVIAAGTDGRRTGAGAGRPAIVFEHFDRERREALVAATDRPPAARATLDDLLEIAAFDPKAWDWPMHRPLFEAARDVDAVWVAAGLPRRRAPQPPQGDGSAGLDGIVGASDWPATAQRALERSLVDGHCGQLPASIVPTMVAVQRRRDASLAEPALSSPRRRTLVVAGNGHIGRVHGVPRYLGAATQGAISVGFLERQGGVPPDLAAIGDDYDWVVVTDAAPREDPCLAFSRSAPTRTPSR